MSKILQVLAGELPPEIQDARRKKYHRDYWHAHPEYREADAARKRERYRTDQAYREKRIEQARQRRAAWTPEQRAADIARQKRRIIAMTPAQYEAHLVRTRAASKRSRAKKKAQRLTQATEAGG